MIISILIALILFVIILPFIPAIIGGIVALGGFILSAIVLVGVITLVITFIGPAIPFILGAGALIISGYMLFLLIAWIGILFFGLSKQKWLREPAKTSYMFCKNYFIEKYSRSKDYIKQMSQINDLKRIIKFNSYRILPTFLSKKLKEKKKVNETLVFNSTELKKRYLEFVIHLRNLKNNKELFESRKLKIIVRRFAFESFPLGIYNKNFFIYDKRKRVKLCSIIFQGNNNIFPLYKVYCYSFYDHESKKYLTSKSSNLSIKKFDKVENLIKFILAGIRNIKKL